VGVSVRVTNVADRRFAICVDPSSREPWVIEVDAARQLHQDLGEALNAVEVLQGLDNGEPEPGR
jgi:hypothetical protein